MMNCHDTHQDECLHRLAAIRMRTHNGVCWQSNQRLHCISRCLDCVHRSGPIWSCTVEGTARHKEMRGRERDERWEMREMRERERKKYAPVWKHIHNALSSSHPLDNALPNETCSSWQGGRAAQPVVMNMDVVREV
jgi:hypothetical protein